MRVDRVPKPCVDRPRFQVALRHAEALLDLQQPVIRGDNELRWLIDQVRHVALDPGQRPGLVLELTVDGLVRAGELHEPVPLDRHLPRFRDLLRDALERPSGIVVLVAVVVHVITTVIAGACRPGLREHVPVRDRLPRGLSPPTLNHIRDLRGLRSEDEVQPCLFEGFLVRLGHHARGPRRR